MIDGPTSDYSAIRVDRRFEGPTGSGQGGWTAQRLQQAIGQPVTVAIRRPIPLETDLRVVQVASSWELVDPEEPDAPFLIATPWDQLCASTDAVTIDAAAEASTRFPVLDDHPVPRCFSCGLKPDSMRVHTGPLGDGRWANAWTVPEWVTATDGSDQAVLWAAMDCAQGFYAGNADDRQDCLTVQLAVDQLAPVKPGVTYAVVAWQGTYPRARDGRKRGAGGAVFADDGTCVARSTSFWISR